MTFTETVDSAGLVVPIVLAVMFLLPWLPGARDGIISIYDAGMFAVYLIVLAWGVVRIVGGKETIGWELVVIAAGCFGWRMYWLFSQYERKLRGPNAFAAVTKADSPRVDPAPFALSPEEEQEREEERFMRRMNWRMNGVIGAAAILFFLIWLIYRTQ
jgi:hypothetical protein